MSRIKHFLAAIILAVAMPAAAHIVEYSALLTGTAEIPPNASPGTGETLVTVDFDLLTMTVHISFAGLMGNTTASHIHCCTPLGPGSANVGVATMLPSFAGFPLGVTSGIFENTFDMTLAASYNPAFITAHGSISGAFNALVAGMESGNAYMNLHTTEFPAGEIRGLLFPLLVPEPGTLALLGLGFAGLGFSRRKQ